MEISRRQKAHSTGDMFTFPAMSHDKEFESELADQLFSNGKFLLHDFPAQPANFTIPRSMMLSRTSSGISSSNGSLLSSRSNSSNSRNSSNTNSSSNSRSSSARTSTSENSSRRKLASINQARSVAIKIPNKECHARNYCNNYGHSQRWQFIAPVPVLNRRNSLKKRKGGKGKREGGVRKGICRRFFGWIVTTCQECHAIEPTKRLKVSM